MCVGMRIRIQYPSNWEGVELTQTLDSNVIRMIIDYQQIDTVA
jgi:hypothetical protein